MFLVIFAEASWCIHLIKKETFVKVIKFLLGSYASADIDNSAVSDMYCT